MTSETKGLLGILIATIVIIGLGAWWASVSDNSQDGGIVAGDTNLLVREDDPFKGPADAPVTVVEFSDFECPACAVLHAPLREVVNRNPDTVKFVYRQFPLSSHEYAQLAAEASLAANAQGKMWDYNDKLFENQSALDEASLIKYAEELGLDTDQFQRELEDGEYRDEVRQDVTDGNALRIQGTPTLFINGIQYTGAYSVDELQAAIDQALGN